MVEAWKTNTFSRIYFPNLDQLIMMSPRYLFSASAEETPKLRIIDKEGFYRGIGRDPLTLWPLRYFGNLYYKTPKLSIIHKGVDKGIFNYVWHRRSARLKDKRSYRYLQ